MYENIHTLIIAPHPDDEVLGCSILLNEQTLVVYFTNGDDGKAFYDNGTIVEDKNFLANLRELEAIEVAKKTGIKQIFMKISEKDIKEQTNLEMVFIRQRRQWMDRLHEITRLCPNLKEIYTTHIHDRHPVHQAVSVIVSGWYFHECKIDGVKLFFYSIFPIDDWIAYQICELNEEDYQTKLDLLKTYKSQWDDFLCRVVTQERPDDFKKETFYVP